MLEALAFVLFKTYVAYMFDQHLRQQDNVMIEGAPQWYYQRKEDHVCASGFAKGDFDSIDKARHRAQDALVRLIDDATKAMVYKHFSENTNPAEQELVKRFESDEALPRFVKAKARFHNVEYQEETNKAFARNCVDRSSLLSYEQERLQKIHVAVIEKYRHEAFDELEAERPADGGDEQELVLDFSPYLKGSQSESSPPQDPFRELEQESTDH
ncbi:MAG: hypothetical protein GY807_02995 [Gammaproteobacteria bacterium]|nr:hypothetical protein [Gammaproteobacteria bacterium]